MDETGTSLSDLRSAAQANPHDPQAWIDLTEALCRHGDRHRAAQALRHAHALAAQDPALLVRASRQYRRLQDFAEGLNAARRAQHLDPSSKDAVLEVAEHLIGLGDPHAASLTLRVAVNQLSEDGDVQLALGRTYLIVDKPHDALRHTQRAAELNAPSLEVQRVLARIYGELGQGEDELRALRTVVGSDKTDIDAAIRLGERLALQGRRREAAEILTRVAEQPPSDAHRLVKLGHALVEAQALVPAVRCLREAIRTNPDLPQAHFQLGLALRFGGATKEAVSSLSTAVRLAPEDPEAGFQLGVALRDAGRLREAAGALIRAAAAAPDDARIQEVLTDTLSALKPASSGSHPAPVSTEVPIAPASQDNTDGGFTGDLAIFSVPELLEFLRNQGASGELTVRAQPGEGRLRLHEGNLTCATYPGSRSLGELLVDVELITLTDLKQRIVRPGDLDQDQLVADVVVSQNLVERSSVEDLLRRQVLEGVRQLISWRTGAVVFQRARSTSRPAVIVDTRWALLEATRLLDEEGR